MTKTMNKDNVIGFFSENPYNVLGLSCTASKHEIAYSVSELKTEIKSNSFHVEGIKNRLYIIDPKMYTDDFVSYVFSKISDFSSKVFAFSSANYTKKFTLNDITVMMDRVDCYDEFLAGYLWLIENDSELAQKDLWGKLCNHIDVLIDSAQADWMNIFDNRFSLEELVENPNAVNIFYNAFCATILSPLKTLAGDQTDSKSAREILFNHISSSRMNNFTPINDDILQMLNDIEHEDENTLHKQAIEGTVSLSNSSNDDFKETRNSSSISLLDGVKDGSELHPRFYHQENRSEDIATTEREQQFTAKLEKSDYQSNYNSMQALDLNSPRHELIKPKVNTGEAMTGLIIEGETVKEVASNSYASGYYNPKRQMKTDTNLNSYERIQMQQKQDKQKSKKIGSFIFLLFLAGVAACAYYFFLR